MKKWILKTFFKKEVAEIKHGILMQVQSMAFNQRGRTRDEIYRGMGIIVEGFIENYKALNKA